MLFLCSFIRVTVAGFLLEPMTYLLLGLSHFSNVRYGGVRLLEWALNLIKKWLVTPLILMILLHQQILQEDCLCVSKDL